MNTKDRLHAWLNAGTFNAADGCRHPQDIIAAALGCTERTVIRCVQQLETEGRLTVDRPRRRGACNTYFVTTWNPSKRVDVLNRLAEIKPLVLKLRADRVSGGCHPKENSRAPRAHTPRQVPVSVIHSCGRARDAAKNEGNRMSTAVRLLKDRLEEKGQRVTGREHDFMAQCPAHDDCKASLHVWEGTLGDAAKVYCHAGCTNEDVVAALGLRLADLFDQTSPQRPEIVATYDYTDELGHLLYQAVRFQPKDFRQRRPDGNGGWLWKLGDTRRVLYRLPRLYAATGNGEPVYVVEGEKDVLAIEKAGGVATTNVGGAAKWRREYGEALRGTDVLIVADRDPAGFDHARRVSLMLAGYAASRRIVVSVVGKDAHDHLTAGYGLEALEPIDGLARNRDGWIPCPWCGQVLVEEIDGTHCGACRITWWGER